MRNWRRTETRTVRPFRSVDGCLQGVRMRLFPDVEFDDRTSFDASDAEERDVNPEFLLAVDRSALEGWRDLPLSLVIRLADARLRRSEVVFEGGLESVPPKWAIPRDVRDRFSWRSGVEASVALLLTSDRPPQPGQPFLRGNWLARKDFAVRAKAEPRAFPVERWTAEDFARRGLPRDSVYWIDFIADDLNTGFDNPADAFRVCLRADAYDAFRDAQETNPARALLLMMVAEILAEVLWRGLRDVQDTEEVQRSGLLDCALMRVEKATNVSRERLHELVAEGELSSLRTFAQAAVGARRVVARLRTTR